MEKYKLIISYPDTNQTHKAIFFSLDEALKTCRLYYEDKIKYNLNINIYLFSKDKTLYVA